MMQAKSIISSTISSGQKQFNHEQAVRMCGEDPNYSKRDLWHAIEPGEYPFCNTKYQIMTPEEAETCNFDPFDVTKVWPRGILLPLFLILPDSLAVLMLVEFPIHKLGSRLVLNKNPDDYHRDVEQAAFSPGSMVPEIETSPDTLLQSRCFFYRYTRYYRVGTNMHPPSIVCVLTVVL
jgi:catalase